MSKTKLVRWQHGETGRECAKPLGEHPGKGWFAIDSGGWLDVGEIVAGWLADHGYDGLVNGDGECGCTLSDFAPCGEMQASCVAAYRHPGKQHGCDNWMMATPHDGDGCDCGAEYGVDDE